MEFVPGASLLTKIRPVSDNPVRIQGRRSERTHPENGGKTSPDQVIPQSGPREFRIRTGGRKAGGFFQVQVKAEAFRFPFLYEFPSQKAMAALLTFRLRTGFFVFTRNAAATRKAACVPCSGSPVCRKFRVFPGTGRNFCHSAEMYRLAFSVRGIGQNQSLPVISRLSAGITWNLTVSFLMDSVQTCNDENRGIHRYPGFESGRYEPDTVNLILYRSGQWNGALDSVLSGQSAFYPDRSILFPLKGNIG